MSGKSKTSLFEKLIAKHGIMGLDTSIFIYQLVGHKKYSPLTDLVFHHIESGNSVGVTSVISVLETLVKPKKLKDVEFATKAREVFKNFPNLEVFSIDSNLGEHAASIRAKYGYRTPDAIQLAVAHLKDASLFITNDKKLKSFRGMKVIVLEDYL